MPAYPADTALVDRPAILFVALQTGASANGGIASLDQIMLALTRYRAIVLTDRESATTRRWRDSGLEVHVVPERASLGLRQAPFGAAVGYWRYFRAVRRILRATGARLVHANDPLAFQLAYAGARSRRGVRLVFNLRDTLPPERSGYQRLYDWRFGQADHTFFLSNDMAARWTKLAPNAAAHCSATYSIVDLERFAPRPPSDETPPVVLLSGVFSPKKGQLAFLREVAPSLAGEGIASWLVGDGWDAESDYAADCRAAADACGNCVRFLGYREDMPELLARARVLVVASRYEGLMRSMIEAMAAGRPVVSTDVASAREMLEWPDQPAGRVSGLNPDQTMATEIIRLCRDESASRKLGDNGAALARSLFDRASVVENYQSVYDCLLAPRAVA